MVYGVPPETDSNSKSFKNKQAFSLLKKSKQRSASSVSKMKRKKIMHAPSVYAFFHAVIR